MSDGEEFVKMTLGMILVVGVGSVLVPWAEEQYASWKSAPEVASVGPPVTESGSVQSRPNSDDFVMTPEFYKSLRFGAKDANKEDETKVANLHEGGSSIQEPSVDASIQYQGQLHAVANKSGSYLNLRDRPGTNSIVLGRMVNGTVLYEIAREDLWVHVRLADGGLGWAYAGHLSPNLAETGEQLRSDTDAKAENFTKQRWQELRQLYKGPSSALPQYQLALSPIRDMIAAVEAGSKGYDAVVYSATVKPPLPVKHLTIKELYDWKEANPGQDYAVGRYQFIHRTLKRIQVGLGVDPNSVFGPGLQDTFADYLLLEIGLADFLNGKVSLDAFQNRIAKVWAGVPKTNGKSHWEGYNGNTAKHANLSEVRRTLEFAKMRYLQVRVSKTD